MAMVVGGASCSLLRHAGARVTETAHSAADSVHWSCERRPTRRLLAAAPKQKQIASRTLDLPEGDSVQGLCLLLP